MNTKKEEIRKIYLYAPRPDLHNLYDFLIKNPPKNYKIILHSFKAENLQKLIIKKSKLAKFIYRNLFKKVFNLIEMDAKKFAHQKIPDVDLIFSVGRIVLRKDIPHVIEIVDKITSLAGNDINLFRKNKKLIEKALLSKNCKKIICWTDACKKDFVREFKLKEIRDKLETVYLSKPVENNIHKVDHKENINLLFVGSINNPNDFLIKGGIETLETFKILSKKYPNLNLFMKCKIPIKIKKKYEKIPQLHIIEEMVSNKDLEKLYKKADIFMTPSHNLNAFAPIEAMEYKLPLVGIDSWAVSEVIQNNVNGFLVKKSERIPYEKEKIYLDIRNKKFLKMICKLDRGLIYRLVEKTELLINNENLRKKFGENGRRMVMRGKFSFEIRQKKLKKIFDEALLN